MKYLVHKSHCSLIAVCILLFSGCTRISHPVATKDFTNQLKTFSTDKFNGYYQDALVNWETLYRLRHWKKDNIYPTDSNKLKLEFNGKNRLSVSLISNNKVENTIILKCRQKHNYLAIRRKFKIIPIPFFWHYEEHKTVIGIDSGDELYLKDREYEFSWLFVLVGESYSFEESIFAKTN